MHDTALLAGKLFVKTYGKPMMVVLDIGGQDVNGSLKSFFVDAGMKYISVDIERHKSVDVVIKPGDTIPFETGSIDMIVSTSCFEHDPCFWMTFKDMCRVVKLGGYIYINAPSNGAYHTYPGDNWRFYSDAGQALAYWSSKQYYNETIYSVKVNETFHIYPMSDVWIDFVCVWERVDEIQTEIVVSNEIKNTIGPLRQQLIDNGAICQSRL